MKSNIFRRLFKKHDTSKASERIVTLGDVSKVPALQKEGTIGAFDTNVTYASNKIVSSKYTLLNFIPKNLFEQFRRLANFYFLIVAVIHVSIPSPPISPATSIMPLVFVVSVTAIKQGYEDYRRHKQDNKVNSAPTNILVQGKVKTVRSEDVKVGDVLKVDYGQQFPCDMLLITLDTGDINCYVTTANLDGESTAKVKEVPPCCRTSSLTAVIKAEAPHANLYDFKGCIISAAEVDAVDSTLVSTPLSTEHLLLRGSTLVDPTHVYGVALYTGTDTKLALNSKIKSNKFSTIEHSMNWYLIMYLCLLLSWLIVSTVLKYQLYGPPVIELMWYVGITEDDPFQTIDLHTVIQDSFAFFILYSYLIPISLYVTLELQKFGTAMFFTWDCEMQDGEAGEMPVCNTSDLNEELGQIQYLLCDKTGTLTENKMTFRGCSVGTTRYDDQDGQLVACNQGLGKSKHQVDQDFERSQMRSLPADVTEFLLAVCLCSTVTVQQKEQQNHEDSTTAHVTVQQKEQQNHEDSTTAHVDIPMKEFTHTLKEGNGDDDCGRSQQKVSTVYQASSPDEKALVEAAARYGVVLLSTAEGQKVLDVAGHTQSFTVVRVFHFESDRRRMSVLLQRTDGTHLLVSKGADSVMWPLCVNGSALQQERIEATQKHLNTFSCDGLRTLVVAKRIVSIEEVEQIERDVSAANRSIANREEALRRVYEKYEVGFELLGSTAVEDRLQTGVKETLEDMREAGVKVWVLTGDKLETAVNVSYLSGHFTGAKDAGGSENELSITGASEHDTCELLLDNAWSESTDVSCPLRLVVDGSSLALLLTQRHRKRFRSLCLRCYAVLCCRLSPKQKAEVVRLIKTSPGAPKVAAIGDGANDVAMIQEAHVGIGIMGSEGRQAVRCSDFAFSKFRFLRKAILVHGRWFYVRVTTLVHYCFYKNLVFILPEFYFVFSSALSSQSIYAGWYLTLYNTTFVALPILVYGFMEQDYPSDYLMGNPQLYRQMGNDARMNRRYYLLWFILGVWHGTASYAGLCLFLYPGQSILYSGVTSDLYLVGTVLVTVIVLVCNIKLVLVTQYLSSLFLLSQLITIVGYVLTLFLYCYLPIADVYGNAVMFFSSPLLLLSALLLTVFCLLPDMVLSAVYQQEKGFSSRREGRMNLMKWFTGLKRTQTYKVYH